MLVGLAVLGRLLPPQVFGEFAVAVAIYGVAVTMTEFGLRQYLVSARDVDRETLESATGLSLAIALGVAAILLLIGALGMSGILPLPGQAAGALVPLALAMPIGPVLLSTEAMLQRDLDFRLIAWSEVVRTGVEVGTGIALALAGYGAFALASGTLISRVALAGVVLGLAEGRGRMVRPRWNGWRRFFSFSGPMVTIQTLPGMVHLVLISALTGIAGAGFVGLLDRARTIQKILDRTLFEAINPVILPAMSASLAVGMEPLRLYRTQNDYLIAICWPAFAAIAVLADPLVMLLLGAQWSEIVPAVQALALTGLALPYTKMTLKLYAALGMVSQYLWVQILHQAVTLALVIPAGFFSLTAVCLAFSLGTICKAICVTLVLRRRFGRLGRDMSISALLGAALTLPAVVAAAGALALQLPPLATLMVAAPLGLLGWLGVIIVSRHPIAGELLGAIRAVRSASRLRPGRAAKVCYLRQNRKLCPARPISSKPWARMRRFSEAMLRRSNRSR